jgi:hypothetical protein
LYRMLCFCHHESPLVVAFLGMTKVKKKVLGGASEYWDMLRHAEE